jgi:hypothetical protein
MLANGKMTGDVDGGYIIGRVVENTKDNLKMTREMDLE